MTWSFRAMEVSDLTDLLVVQKEGAVAALSNVFPQEHYPFPTEELRDRWLAELEEPDIHCYVATESAGQLVGFAARRGDEVLHFGTALRTWGSGLGQWMHDSLLATYPPEVELLRLRVFAANARAQRFYEGLGWHPTGLQSTTTFPPHPTLLEYARKREMGE